MVIGHSFSFVDTKASDHFNFPSKSQDAGCHDDRLSRINLPSIETRHENGNAPAQSSWFEFLLLSERLIRHIRSIKREAHFRFNAAIRRGQRTFRERVLWSEPIRRPTRQRRKPMSTFTRYRGGQKHRGLRFLTRSVSNDLTGRVIVYRKDQVLHGAAKIPKKVSAKQRLPLATRVTRPLPFDA